MTLTLDKTGQTMSKNAEGTRPESCQDATFNYGGGRDLVKQGNDLSSKNAMLACRMRNAIQSSTTYIHPSHPSTAVSWRRFASQVALRRPEIQDGSYGAQVMVRG